jgi:PAS domain S-box-containing protein
MLVTVWETDPQGRANYQSPSWYEYVGEDAAAPDDWLRHCHPDDRRSLLAEWRKCIESNGERLYDVEVRVRGKDGEYRWFRVSGTPIVDEAGRVSKWIGTCKEVARAAKPQRSSAPVLRHVPSTLHSILVVDDNVDAVTAFALLLRQLGHQVEEAHDGVTALAVARRMRPSVIFLDLNMPRMGGHDVARALRADPAFGRTLIVAVSGFGQPNDVEAARAAGFDHYIVKPYDIDFVKSLLGGPRVTPLVSQPRAS